METLENSEIDEPVFKPFDLQLLNFDFEDVVTTTENAFKKHRRSQLKTLHYCDSSSEDNVNTEDDEEESLSSEEQNIENNGINIVSNTSDTDTSIIQEEKIEEQEQKTSQNRPTNVNEKKILRFKVSNVTHTLLKIEIIDDISNKDLLTPNAGEKAAIDVSEDNDKTENDFVLEDHVDEFLLEDCELCHTCKVEATLFCIICDKRFCVNFNCQKTHSCVKESRKILKFLYDT